MCGIAGFFGTRKIGPEISSAMLRALQKRGPDAQQSVRWSSDFIQTAGEACFGLLHARLSIIDPRPVANQPMSNEAGDVWICYNGEVYDWKNDAGTLEQSGITFRSHSDTEFILRAYERWGDAFLSRLRGMFALAILDFRTRRVLLARDRLGLKPLLYYWDGENFAFGSTLRSLVPYLPQRRLSQEGLDAYLAHRYVPAPLSILKDVHRLPNAHSITIDLEHRRLDTRRYWEPSAASDGSLQSVLDESVRMRMAADRPVGLFLSGGIDSATIASSLARQGYSNITAFTAAFPGSPYDESGQAGMVAGALGLPHHSVPIEPNLRDDFDQIVADLDEPFADPSALPVWYLARETSRHVKVVLGGDGGDELFAGYGRYRQHLRSAWRRRLTLPARVHDEPWEKSARRREEIALPWDQAYVMRFSGLSPALRRYLQPGYVGRAVYWRDMPSKTRAARMVLLDIDFANYLPEYILRKGDLCTMAHGLELRAPLLDHCLVERVSGIPPRIRFSRPAKKLLVATCPPCQQFGLLRAKKHGFTPPLRAWLYHALVPRMEGLGPRLATLTDHQISAPAVAMILDRYRSGISKLAEPIYQLLVLDTALQQLVHL